MRRDLADEAMRLGRVLAGLLPREPEVHGLVALMELQASRFDARGRAGPCCCRTRTASRWDRTLIEHGLAAAGPRDRDWAGRSARTPCRRRSPPATAGPGSFEDTDWEAVVALYDALAQLAPSPVVELNRAVAVLHADGPEAALVALDAIRDDPRLARYHLSARSAGTC